jgi:4-amino-4-deoxy-L-arabinose transferase-like glycosyltransferase
VRAFIRARSLEPDTSATPFLAFLREKWLPLAIVIGGAALRLWEFGSIPPGLNQDEASLGYDTYAVLHYGIDRNGFHNPVLFVAWGSGMSALPGYLATPFILLFGLSTTPLRMVNALVGIGSIAAFYALVRRSGDRTLAILSAFFLAISPWHIMMSRWALGTNLLPALFLVGVYFLVRGRDGNRWLIAAGFFFALTLWTYGTAYVVTPLFLALAAVSLYRWRPRKWRPVLEGAGVFLLTAVPIALFFVINQFRLEPLRASVFSIPRLTIPRYQTRSTFFSDHPLAAIRQNVEDLWRLLVSGDDGLIWNAIPGYGYLYFLGFGLSALGIAVTLARGQWWKSEVHYFFAAWLSAALFLSLFALEEININRITILFVPLIFFAAVAVRELAVSRGALAAILVFFVLLLAQFAHSYFGWYRTATEPVFGAGFGAAVDKLARSTSGPVCITTQINEPYIYVLFYRKLDPHVFVRSVRYVNPGAEFQQVASFGRYTFGLRRCDRARVQGYVLAPAEEGLVDRERFTLERLGRWVVALRRPQTAATGGGQG